MVESTVLSSAGVASGEDSVITPTVIDDADIEIDVDVELTELDGEDSMVSSMPIGATLLLVVCPLVGVMVVVVTSGVASTLAAVELFDTSVVLVGPLVEVSSLDADDCEDSVVTSVVAGAEELLVV